MNLVSFIVSFTLFMSVTWLTDFEQAKSQAKKNNQLILLNFSGSDWCAPCIKMKQEIFDTQTFQDFAGSNLVLIRADFPRHKKNQPDPGQKARNEKLADQFNPDGKFPLTLLIDANGKVICQWDGYTNMSVDTFISEILAKSHGR